MSDYVAAILACLCTAPCIWDHSKYVLDMTLLRSQKLVSAITLLGPLLHTTHCQ